MSSTFSSSTFDVQCSALWLDCSKREAWLLTQLKSGLLQFIGVQLEENLPTFLIERHPQVIFAIAVVKKVHEKNPSQFKSSYSLRNLGHYIQACPTNDDPAYDGRSRVKRTTGIPRTFLIPIEKPAALTNDGTVDDTIQPAGVMVNAEGDWVIAQPDNASWAQYQAKAKMTAAAREAEALGSKELQEKGLECSMDKRLFVEPTKTPCCGTTYCHDCITNALLENDLTCPHCSKDSILIDNLVADDEMNAKIQVYEDEKAASVREREKSKTPPKTVAPTTSKQSNSPKKSDSAVKHTTESTASSSNTTTNSTKKRPAETELKNDRTAPAARTAENVKRQLNAIATKPEASSQQVRAASKDNIHQQQPLANVNYMLQQGMSTMPFPTQTGYMGFPMGMESTLPMDPGLWNLMMMQAGSFVADNSYQNTWPTAYPQQPTNSHNFGFQQGMMPTGFAQQAPYMPMGNGFMGPGSNNRGGMGTFSNQQRTTFSAPTLNDEDSAYFRKPVNPHRHQARRNINRPTDYHEI